MATQLSPGISLTEKRKGTYAAPGVSTAIGGFYGITERGPVDTPTLITSPADYEEVFGERLGTTYVADAVMMFFKQGGRSCYVGRVPFLAAAPGATASKALSAVLGAGTTGTLFAANVGAWGNKIKHASTKQDTTVTACGTNAAGATTSLVVASTARLKIGDQISVTKAADTQRSVIIAIDGTTLTLATSITIPVGGYSSTESVVLETFSLEFFDKYGRSVIKHTGLRNSPLAGANYWLYRINNSPRTLMTLTDGGLTPSATVDPRPAVTASNTALTGGSDGTAASDTEYKGTSAAKTGIYSFNKVKDVNMISLPGVTSTAVIQEFQVYAELRQDVLMIFEPPQGYSYSQYLTWVTSTVNVSSSYLAVYWPWVKIQDPTTLTSVSIPPSGAVQGIIARVHARRNFGKAPAGVPDAIINGVLELDTEIFDGSPEYDAIYPSGLNALINFVGEGGIAVFGSRTLDPTGEFAQITDRIIFNTAKRQIKKLTRFANFEPNNDTLWASISRGLTSLFRGWREAGVLYGSSDDEAFFIICSADNNTALVRQQGKVKIRVGLATNKPGEFIEVELEQDTRAIDAELAALS